MSVARILQDMKLMDLDEALAAPARLAIVATLVRGQRMTYMVLREETGLADGNLHVQTKKLIAAGYLTRERVHHGKRVITRFELTERGRMMFLKYINQLREAVEGPYAAASRAGDMGKLRKPDSSRVW